MRLARGLGVWFPGSSAPPGLLTAGGARRGAPPQAGEGEMARSVASEPGLSLLCKVTFKSGPQLSPAAASSSLAAKASLGGSGGGGLFSAASGAISYAEVLKQGPLAPEASRPSGEVPRGTQEAEGGDGDGEGCSGPPSAPASHARTLTPPSYTTFPGSKPKFDWVIPPDGPERHFRFSGAGGGVGAPRRRATSNVTLGPLIALWSHHGGRTGPSWPDPIHCLDPVPDDIKKDHIPGSSGMGLSTPTNHLSEPRWVTTITLAGSLVAGLEHYDLQATHSN
ncbi:hypothetical protein E2I00_001092 [Balaenoptera physalus]|uniref:Uncharacterized protein n=1 Tax=Balaenoptera physalus TaxID=9770 RepID=A0A643BSG9_BALPH|nr:hypothetical protein E2I00_001092 [Balaenoptera physalus]